MPTDHGAVGNSRATVERPADTYSSFKTCHQVRGVMRVSSGAAAAARTVVERKSKPYKQQDGQRSHLVISPSEAAKICAVGTSPCLPVGVTEPDALVVGASRLPVRYKR